jgi:hypothetical protein
VTRFGVPVAEVKAPSAPIRKGSRLGSMAGSVKIKGDIVDPASDPRDWEALRK